MTSYILILMLGTSAGRVPTWTAATSAEFATKAACEAAGEAVKRGVTNPAALTLAVYTCQPKGR